MLWQTSKRIIDLSKPAVMGILNVTPDSFSDGGRFANSDAALKRVEEMIAEGVDIIDVGGESTRPGSVRIEATVEIDRTAPIIESIAARFDVPVSIDTSKSTVAKAAIEAGAEIINDISGLRFDPRIAEAAASHTAGLVLMHSRGEFESMHSQLPVEDIFMEVTTDFDRSISTANRSGVRNDQIVLDVGIGFGKTIEQNLALIANLDKLTTALRGFPLLVGVSRKSFIGKVLDLPSAGDRLPGSLACGIVAAWNGASILRVHDVKETAEAIRMVSAMAEHAKRDLSAGIVDRSRPSGGVSVVR